MLNRRDSLLGLFEAEWGVIGWELQIASTITDVRNALKPIDSGLQHHIQAFMRETQMEATAVALRKRASELRQLNKEVRVVAGMEQRCRESLDKVSAALQQVKSTDKEKEFASIFKRRKAEYDKALCSLQILRGKERSIQEQYESERAFFAQAELLRFVLDRRYAFTPLNLANAMAGLPEMGYRQSAKKCSRHKPRFGDNAGYWLFKLVRRAISGTSRLPIVELAEQALRHHKNRTDYRVVAAKKNWYHLRRAIEAVDVSRRHPASRTYRIIANYQRNLQRRDSVELLLEEEEQLS